MISRSDSPRKKKKKLEIVKNVIKDGIYHLMGDLKANRL